MNNQADPPISISGVEAFVWLLQYQSRDGGDDEETPFAWMKDGMAGDAEQTYSPLEMVLMMKSDLTTVQQVYEMNPDALTLEVFHNVCRNGSQPGVLGYLVENFSDTLDIHQVDTVLGYKSDFPIECVLKDGLGPGRPAEEDIIKLLDHLPGEVYGIADGVGNDALSWALEHYSNKLVHYISKKMATKNQRYFNRITGEITARPSPRRELTISISETSVRSSVDVDLVDSFAPLLAELWAFQAAGRVDWSMDAWISCMRKLLQNNKLSEVHLEMNIKASDNGVLIDDGHYIVDGKLQQEPALNSLLQLASTCAVKTVFLNSDAIPVSSGVPDFFWSLISAMPKLESLTLSITGRCLFTFDSLGELIRTSLALKWLAIISWLGKDLTKYILDPLEDSESPSLTGFDYKEAKLIAEGLESPQKRLLKILQTRNMTLTKASIGYCICAKRNTSSESRSLQEMIRYYTELNRCGRSVAQNPQTKLWELVQLLHPEEEVVRPMDSVDVINIRYGLLRESPSLWASQAIKAMGRTGKRKRVDEAPIDADE